MWIFRGPCVMLVLCMHVGGAKSATLVKPPTRTRGRTTFQETKETRTLRYAFGKKHIAPLQVVSE